MKRTNKYQLSYFEQDDFTSAEVEMQRWETLDAQLFALFATIGNGIEVGWDLESSDGLAVAITPGSGHVAFVAVESLDTVIISNLVPNTRSYVYAELQENSYWTKSVNFSIYNSYHETDDYSLYLGYVDTDDTSITNVDMENRDYLGFRRIIDEIVAEHRHIGGTLNPSPIDLSSEVQGTLNQANIPDLDASKITTGTINADRLPKIDHITGLTNQGTLTHSQLDAWVETLSLADNKLMGEVSTINLLQLILALKHVYPDIDEYLVNEISFIPGISPDDYVDWTNTTADVDTRTYAEGGQHTISMTPVAGMTAYTHIWDTEDDFTDSTNSNVFIDGDSVCLSTTSNRQELEDFSSIEKWVVITENLSDAPNVLTLNSSDYVIPPASGQLSITNQETEMALVIRRDFDAQDWSAYNSITFFLKTEDAEHGDWLFYLSDSVAGVQNSYTLVLNRNTPTINIDTLLNGWQEITVDLTPYVRSSINTIGFYTSTQDGWNTSQAFNLNIDDIYLSTGNEYETTGYLRVIFGSEFLYKFWRIRWDTIIPTDVQALGISFKTRTRVANSEAALATSDWSTYSTVSGSTISLPTDSFYKYIEIEAFFGTSTNKSRTPCLKNLYLDFYVSDANSEFAFDSQADWETGSRFNIDTTTTPGSIQISGVSDLGKYYYGTDGSAGRLASNFANDFSIYGSVLPKTTYQELNNLSPSFGYISGISRGDSGNLWLADTDNDRIVKIDRYGNLILGFYGSFLSTPSDPYGTEDSGPGSNVNVSSTSTTSSTSVTDTEFNVLHSLYNTESGTLYIVFDKNLENIYSSSTKLNMNLMYLKVNALKFNLNDSTVELLGVPEEKSAIWNTIKNTTSEATEFIDQFTFDSHVLKITLNGADKTFLNHVVLGENPSVAFGYPYQGFQTSNSSIELQFFLRDCVLGTASGQSGIQISVDGAASTIIYTNTYTISGLSNGSHEVEIQLVDDTSTPYTNIESYATLNFTKLSSYTNPYIKILSPKVNQIYSANPVSIQFEVDNFPVVPSGQHIKYQVDGGTAINYYSTEPIILSNLDAGKHTVRLFTVDTDGNQLVYTYGDLTVEFIVGLNSSALVKLYMNRNAIYDTTGTIPVATSRTYTDVANVYFENIYSPIDVQVIADDASGLTNGETSVVVAKLRSQSWLNGMSDQDNATEIAVRAENVARAASGTALLETNPALVNVPTNMLIFGTYYLDGHSVVQLDMTGNTVFSNNAARFAESKTRAKEILGSAEKTGSTELLIGDSINKRAIVVYTDLATGLPLIEWQYDSDRFIPDFHLSIQETIVIDIYNDSVSENNMFVRQGATVVWRNRTSSPITIYSGTTSYTLFQQDPDLNLYGSVFTSPVIDPGETYSYKFITYGEFDWFVYPDILTGKINVTRQRLSSRDMYYILESDGEDSPFTSRLIKVDSWGNILWSFGETYLVKPRDVRPMLNGNVLIST